MAPMTLGYVAIIVSLDVDNLPSTQQLDILITRSIQVNTHRHITVMIINFTVLNFTNVLQQNIQLHRLRKQSGLTQTLIHNISDQQRAIPKIHLLNISTKRSVGSLIRTITNKSYSYRYNISHY